MKVSSGAGERGEPCNESNNDFGLCSSSGAGSHYNFINVERRERKASHTKHGRRK